MSSNSFKNPVVATLCVAFVAFCIAIGSYSTYAYRTSMENRERIAVLESTQRIMLQKLNEISLDVKTLLSSRR